MLKPPRKIGLNEKPQERAILIIDAEVQFRRMLRISLEANGYKVYEAVNGRQGLTELAGRNPDLVLLELTLPDMDGMEVIRQFRQLSNLPIMVLSALATEGDKVTALSGGADDYLTKPFGIAELLARLHVAFRRTHVVATEDVFTSGRLTVDMSARSVSVNGQPVKLTRTEYELLQILLRNAGRVLTYPQLLESVWGPGHVNRTHYLHVYMTYLREKIERNPAEPELLKTVPRVGYRLQVHTPVLVEAEPINA